MGIRNDARRALLAGALALAGACGREPASEGPAVQRTATVVDGRLDFRGDDRLAHLLGGCARTDPFTGDTHDLLATRVDKLATSEATVASRARADVLAAGEAALPHLRRAFERWFASPGHAPRLLALLDLAGATRSEGGRELALQGLEHPSECVRTAAVRALATHPRAEDYDRLLALAPGAGVELVGEIGRGLLAADRARLERDVAGWLADPARARWIALLAPRIAPGSSPELRGAVLGATGVAPEARIAFLAAHAAAGEADALAELRGDLRHENPARRQIAAQAALASGLRSEVAAALARDADPAQRAVAVEALAGLGDEAAARDGLRAALADADATVRKAALTELCRRGDREAIDRALALLEGTSDDVATALAALRAPLAGDPALARTAFDALVEGISGGSRADVRALERAIGQMPLAEAAQLLIERASAGEAPIQGLPAHRWYALQASNSGEPGRAWLRARWDAEADLLRRLDLIQAGTQEAGTAVDAFLRRVLESPRASDWERLYAADLLARSAPAESAAPLLKRVAFLVEVPEARRAFHCLLWRHYGPEP